MKSEISVSSKTENYQAYLVRLWRSSAHSPWRASIQQIETGRQVRFANVEELFLFMHEQTTSISVPKPGE